MGNKAPPTTGARLKFPILERASNIRRASSRRLAGLKWVLDSGLSALTDVLWLGCRLGTDGQKKGRFRGELDELFVADRARSEKVADYKRCFELFDGRDETAVADSRERWKVYKAAGHTVVYWQQTPAGGWEKKA